MVFLQYSMVRDSMKQNRVVVSTHGDHPKSVEISVVENTYMPYTSIYCTSICTMYIYNRPKRVLHVRTLSYVIHVGMLVGTWSVPGLTSDCHQSEDNA